MSLKKNYRTMRVNDSRMYQRATSIMIDGFWIDADRSLCDQTHDQHHYVVVAVYELAVVVWASTILKGIPHIIFCISFTSSIVELNRRSNRSDTGIARINGVAIEVSSFIFLSSFELSSKNHRGTFYKIIVFFHYGPIRIGMLFRIL